MLDRTSRIPSTGPNFSSFHHSGFGLPQPFERLTDEINVLPDVCDTLRPSEECIQTLAADASGAKIWYDVNHGCSSAEKSKLERAFQDSRAMLKYASKWSVDRSPWDSISAEYWMGWDWGDYANRIQGNLQRASDFINDPGYKKYYITVSCSDPLSKCRNDPAKGKPGEKQRGGYAWNIDGWVWTYGHINMCEPFYTLDSITAKMEDVNYWQKHGAIDQLEDMSWYGTYAQYFIHEMMHLSSTSGPEPHIFDQLLKDSGAKAYGPVMVRKLAKSDKAGSTEGSGASASTINADSYAMLVNSIFWWDTTGYWPTVPSKKTPKRPPAVITLPSVTFDNSTEISTEMISDALTKEMESYDAEDDTDELSGDIAGDQNICHGVSGDYWVMSRDIVVENVKTFCAQSDPEVPYNVGSVNELELSVNSPDEDSTSPQDAPDCVGRFIGAVIDGCDGADFLNNPHNYKFGSTLITDDGWEYTMTPLSKQVNEVNCDVSYKFFLDSFEIRGKNWPDATLGANGEGLHAQLSGCGAVTKWKFETTPDDCCFQWYASGQLPIGTRSCVGNAVQSAGGSGKDKCHGPGKRTANGTDAIDRWPGYGDDSKHVFRNGG